MTPTSTNSADGRPLILIAEDEKTTRQALARYLDIKGFSVLEAADGNEALELFKQHEPNVRLCLIDLHMPFVDGPACISAIRDKAPDLPIFLLTGELDERGISEELASTVQKRFLKPFDWARLMLDIQTTLKIDPPVRPSKNL